MRYRHLGGGASSSANELGNYWSNLGTAWRQSSLDFKIQAIYVHVSKESLAWCFSFQPNWVCSVCRGEILSREKTREQIAACPSRTYLIQHSSNLHASPKEAMVKRGYQCQKHRLTISTSNSTTRYLFDGNVRHVWCMHAGSEDRSSARTRRGPSWLTIVATG